MKHKLIMENWRKFVNESGTYASSKYRNPAGDMDADGDVDPQDVADLAAQVASGEPAEQDVNQMIKKYVEMHRRYESAYRDDYASPPEIQSYERGLDDLEAKIKELMPDFEGGRTAQKFLDPDTTDAALRAGEKGNSRRHDSRGSSAYGSLVAERKKR